MRDGFQNHRIDQANRLALVQAAWTQVERRRRRELASFLQRRLAWQLSLDASHHERQPQTTLTRGA